MNSVAEDLKDLLVAEGVATFESNLFFDLLPDRPDLCAAVRETGSWRMPEANTGIEYPTAQVLVRGGANNILGARDFMQSIYAAIRDALPQTINSTWYGGFWVASGPASIGRDERQRPVYSVNFRIMRGDE